MTADPSKQLITGDRRLFYTSEGELDFGWLILATCSLVGLGVFVTSALGWIPGPSVAAWAWFGSFTSFAFLAGAAIARARLIASSSVPGDVAQGIAGGRPFGVSTTVFDDGSNEL